MITQHQKNNHTIKEQTMKTKTLAITFLLVFLSSTALIAGSQPKMDIVDTAVSAGSFNTLVAAIQAAGLAETLKGYTARINQVTFA